MVPQRHRCLLAIALKKITTTDFIFSRVWQLKVCSISSQQQFEKVIISITVIELNEAAKSFSKIMEELWFRSIQESFVFKSLGVKELSKTIRVTAVVETEVIAQVSSCANTDAARIVCVEAGTGHDVQNPTKTIPKFRRESPRNHIYGLDYFR